MYLSDHFEKIFYEHNQYLIKNDNIDSTKLYIDGTFNYQVEKDNQ
ncbi:hypothetical protein [Acholeplasma granularum]|nr:hypothetical protein [Acholeplasma granularum]